MQAVKDYEENKVDRILLVRPAVATESIGYLPGNIEEKFDPYIKPIYDVLITAWGVDKTTNLINKGLIEIAPLAFMRGRTFNNCVVILDEAQNATYSQLKMFLSRLGENVKCLVTGDPSQSDLGKNNGLNIIINKLEKCKSVKIINFERNDIVRSNIVKDILLHLEKSC